MRPPSAACAAARATCRPRSTASGRTTLPQLRRLCALARLPRRPRRAGRPRSPRRCAIMCSEAVWWRCHRRIVADHLLARGETVLHLMAPGREDRAASPPAPSSAPTTASSTQRGPNGDARRPPRQPARRHPRLPPLPRPSAPRPGPAARAAPGPPGLGDRAALHRRPGPRHPRPRQRPPVRRRLRRPAARLARPRRDGLLRPRPRRHRADGLLLPRPAPGRQRPATAPRVRPDLARPAARPPPPALRLLLAVGGHAQRWHLGPAAARRGVTATVREAGRSPGRHRQEPSASCPLPHPLLAQQPLARARTRGSTPELLPALRAEIATLLAPSGPPPEIRGQPPAAAPHSLAETTAEGSER